MPSQIEARYGVPLPIDALWRELEQRYGAEAVTELHAVYRKATRRYTRAAELNKIRRIVARWDRGDSSILARKDKQDRWRAALVDPQAYIDGE